MKNLILVLGLVLFFNSFAQASQPKAKVHCYDDVYRDLDMDFWYNYSIKVVAGKHVLFVTKSKYEENDTPEVLSKTVVKQIVSPNKIIYRNLDNSESLTIMKDNMGTGISKKAGLAATNMQCMRNVEVDF